MHVKIHGTGNQRILMDMGSNNMKNAEIIYSNLELFNKRKLDIEKNFLINFNERVSDFFSSSGRIELLGNHTDHNGGKILAGSGAGDCPMRRTGHWCGDIWGCAISFET